MMSPVGSKDSLRNTLDTLTAPARLVTPLENGDVRCTACGHRCLIHPGRRGICQVRFNKDGELRAPWGYVAALQVDPVEKKPFFHFMPGSNALTFGMLGCDFHCGYCQNWLTSQALTDPNSYISSEHIQKITPEQLVTYARLSDAEMIVSSYNEPLITSEWAVEVFKKAKEAGLRCAFVSNGNTTPEAIEFLRPYLSAYKIDLKSMQDRNYRKLGGVLKQVLESIQRVHDAGLWLEVVTLVVPGFNDSPEELWEMSRFVASVSPDIPWHVTAFHPDYKMTDHGATQGSKLQQAAEIGQEAGLRYVYAGNIPGRVGSLEDTICPSCQRVLIRRRGFTILEYHLTAQGTCPTCKTAIPGQWSSTPEQVTLQGLGFPRRFIR